MSIKVVIKRRKPGVLSEAEARRQRLQSSSLSKEERYIEILFESRESGRIDPFTSNSPQVARWYAKQLGMIAWVAGDPIQHQIGRCQQHGFFQLYSLEKMEARLLEIMKTIRVDRLFICQANRPPSAGITYMRGLGSNTTVLNVTWTLNRANNLIPQIRIKPIQIGTTVINYVTGHSATFIRDNGLGPGAQIRVCQAGTTKPIIDAVLAMVEPALPEPA